MFIDLFLFAVLGVNSGTHKCPSDREKHQSPPPQHFSKCLLEKSKFLMDASLWSDVGFLPCPHHGRVLYCPYGEWSPVNTPSACVLHACPGFSWAPSGARGVLEARNQTQSAHSKVASASSVSSGSWWTFGSKYQFIPCLWPGTKSIICADWLEFFFKKKNLYVRIRTMCFIYSRGPASFADISDSGAGTTPHTRFHSSGGEES